MERRPPVDEKEMQHEEEMQREEELRDKSAAAERAAERTDDESARATHPDELASDERDLPPPAREEVPPTREEPAAADEQLTVPEDSEAAAMAEGRQPSVMPQPERDTSEVFSEADLDDYRRRWDTLQASFVDDPWTATEQASALAGDLVRRLSDRYETLRGESPGGSAEDADTEVLRHTVRGYRSIFRAVVG
jgi:hypothetical protein